ncbi:BAG family molecular chaperone regulator 7 [Linum grandiflorum]
MRRSTRVEIFDPFCFPSPFLDEYSIFPSPASSFFHEELLLLPPPTPSFELFETVTDLIQVEKTPSYCSYKRIQHQKPASHDLYLQTLSERVSSLESKFEQLLVSGKSKRGGDRKYTWTAEIKEPVERKYKWTAEIKGADEEEEKKKKVVVKKVAAAAAAEKKKYKWTAEIKGKGDEWKKYSFEVSNGEEESGKSEKKKEEVKKVKKSEEEEKKKKKKPTNNGGVRVVEIDEPDSDHGVIVLRQAFAKRAGAMRTLKGKKKELSPQDAALLIQITFRAYLIRRSQALRALRELAIAKAKLKELRGLFNNFSYRRQVSRDAVERQRFSEKIIVLLLTVDAIEGADLMVRASKRSMVDELEAMLEVVDPQPAPGGGAARSLSMRRRTFDMPDGEIRREIAEGVAQVVQMLEEEENA